METENMRVTKRNGELEEIAFDKILNRIRKLGQEVNLHVNYQQLTMKVIDQLYDTISTTQIDIVTAEQAFAMSTLNADYDTLAGRILVSNHQKNTDPVFYNVTKELCNFIDVKGIQRPLISEKYWEFVSTYREELNAMIVHERDYLIDFFGFKTLERAYLFKKNEKVIERPQHMWLRVSVGIHGDLSNPNALKEIKESYDLMSQKYFTHATPTLFNAGTPRPQMSSCYLMAMEDDSIEGIFNTLKDCALISKYSGGIGLHIHNIRAKDSHIQGTNGKTNGLVPMLRVYNNTAKYVNQGGKRNGSFAIYLEPWHPDLFGFLDMRKNRGDEELRGRDLFYALWIPDLFMERVKEPDAMWSFFCPHECPGLADVYGAEFKALYEKYESAGLARLTMPARKVWSAILDSQMEVGTPYMLYKDACNMKSNHKNIGVIKSSNLCCEIIEYSDAEETAVCNLASIGLPSFVNQSDHSFNYEKLHEVTKVVTNNLNKVIDINFYPTEKTRRSNLRHRPIGIGVQGLADTFAMMNIPFHSENAREVNRLIFETIYHAALEKSNELAIERKIVLQEKMKLYRHTLDYLDILNQWEYDAFIKGNKSDYLGAYSTFIGSPASQGVLQFDMWGATPSERYDWTALKESIKKNGIRNSLLVAPMPTASTSQILGYNECFEPFTSNIYSRGTLAGDFIRVNKYLMKDLVDLGVWNEATKNQIIANRGSIQSMTNLPEHIRNKYKIAWEIPMKQLIDMSADRGPYICQSQSLNLWMKTPNYKAMTSMHFYAWEKGLKTGIYYFRTQAKHQAQQFTIEPETNNSETKEEETCTNCSA